MDEASSSKRKAPHAIAPFKPSWEEAYLFTEHEGSIKCLACLKLFSCVKSYNLKRHYDANHAKDYANLKGEERLQVIQILKENISQAENNVPVIDELSDFINKEEAVRCSYKIAFKIAKSSRPYTNGEFIRNWLRTTGELCPEELKHFDAISLSRATITRRIQEMSNDITRQLTDLGQKFTGFSLAVDETTDLSGARHLAIFIRGVNENLEVIEGLLDFCSLTHTTTAENILSYVEDAVDNIHLDWEKLVSVTTNGTSAMMDKYIDFVDRLRTKLKNLAVPPEPSVIHGMVHQQNLCAKSIELQHVMSVILRITNYIRSNDLKHKRFKTFLNDIESEHGELLLHTKVRWLSPGEILDQFFHLRNEIVLFMDIIDYRVPELENDDWVCDLAFFSDITDHLSVLNIHLQEKDRTVINYYDSICAFKAKIKLWTRQFEMRNVCHFAKLGSVITPDINLNRYEDILRNLDDEFSKRFHDLYALENDFKIVGSPFSVDILDVPPQFQLELIDLTCNIFMKGKFQTGNDIGNFYKNFPQDKYPRLHKLVSKVMAMFGSTYMNEKLFSILKKTKSTFRTAMSDFNLKCSLMLSTQPCLVPNVTHLLEVKRLQVPRYIDNQTMNNQTTNNQTTNNQTMNNQAMINQTMNYQTINNQTMNYPTINNQTINNQTVNQSTIKQY
ncbi:general transcription factor II-I repeat domain-containing protein 2-like isoform X2 [Andrena cerasifolii]|uniref:general transcription factor II-I repeat domain-containing protein 2-like isoform X2 n=1 Tax=Andrena cerasifolii TaxID=2819439 RepID=UPI00403809D1